MAKRRLENYKKLKVSAMDKLIVSLLLVAHIAMIKGNDFLEEAIGYKKDIKTKEYLQKLHIVLTRIISELEKETDIFIDSLSPKDQDRVIDRAKKMNDYIENNCQEVA